MSDADKILDNLKSLCSRREYCSSDIRKKALKALEGNENEVEKIVQELLSERYVDDFRYASAYARDKSSIAGWGEVKIRYMLSSKGIARETIDAALEEVDRNKAVSRLEKMIENKYRVLKEDPQWKIKLLRYILGRGYSYSEVNDIINRLDETHKK